MKESTKTVEITESIIKSWFVMLDYEARQRLIGIKTRQLSIYDMYEEFASHAELTRRELKALDELVVDGIPF